MVGSHVYVIEAGSSAVKVGMARRPEERLRDLQTAHYEKLSLVHVIECDEREVGRIERAAHAILKEKRRSGEWFSVSADEAKIAVEQAIVVIQNEGHLEQQSALQRAEELRDYACCRYHGEQFRPLGERDMEVLEFCMKLVDQSGCFTDDRAFSQVEEAALEHYFDRRWPGFSMKCCFSRIETFRIDVRPLFKAPLPMPVIEYGLTGLFRFSAFSIDGNGIRRRCIQVEYGVKLAVWRCGIPKVLEFIERRRKSICLSEQKVFNYSL